MAPPVAPTGKGGCPVYGCVALHDVAASRSVWTLGISQTRDVGDGREPVGPRATSGCAMGATGRSSYSG